MADSERSGVRREPFGTTHDGQPVERYVMGGPDLEVSILTWGASLQTVLAPDRDGALADVVLGFDDLSGYTGEHPYLGATVGRFANRIAGAHFTLDGTDYRTSPNEGGTTLHGGTRGFDRHVWTARPLADGVELSHVSVAGDMGFPGRLEVVVSYTVSGSRLQMTYRARADEPTVVNLTNHAYVNLSGAHAGIDDHSLLLAADSFLPVDDDLIPTGELRDVDGTPMDFRTSKAIASDLGAGTEQLQRADGYDHTWVLRPAADPAVRLADPGSGRVLEVRTDQPGVQFYSGNLLDGSLVGKGRQAYGPRAGLCLETQHFPDSPNRPEFPSTVLRPGETLRTTTTWAFGTTAAP